MHPTWAVVPWCGAAFLLGAAMTWLVLGYARTRMIDVPNERSSHTNPKPRGGGLGFLGGFFATGAFVHLFEGPSALRGRMWFALLLLVIPLATVGFVDDRRGMPRSVRYAVHSLCATGLVWWCGPVALPMTGADAFGSAISVTFTLIGVTAVINFYNFMDGIDGLVAGVSAVQFGFAGLWLNQPIWLILSAALAGFLLWNWSPSKLFMGDVGSTALGGLAAAAVLGTAGNSSWTWYSPVVFLPLVGDAVYTIFRRILRRDNVFVGHHSHIYQRLTRLGWSHSRTSAIYIGLTIASGLLVTSFGPAGAIASTAAVAVLAILAEVKLARSGVPFVASVRGAGSSREQVRHPSI